MWKELKIACRENYLLAVMVSAAFSIALALFSIVVATFPIVSIILGIYLLYKLNLKYRWKHENKKSNDS